MLRLLAVNRFDDLVGHPEAAAGTGREPSSNELRGPRAVYQALGFEPTGEREALASDPSLETIIMSRSP
jgi:hypothetical protein